MNTRVFISITVFARDSQFPVCAFLVSFLVRGWAVNASALASTNVPRLVTDSICSWVSIFTKIPNSCERGCFGTYPGALDGTYIQRNSLDTEIITSFFGSMPKSICRGERRGPRTEERGNDPSFTVSTRLSGHGPPRKFISDRGADVAQGRRRSSKRRRYLAARAMTVSLSASFGSPPIVVVETMTRGRGNGGKNDRHKNRAFNRAREGGGRVGRGGAGVERGSSEVRVEENARGGSREADCE